MKRQTKPAKGWGERVDKLIRATGWPSKDWPRHFGLGLRALNRIRLRGKLPWLWFLTRLEALEREYASEIQALAQGAIAHARPDALRLAARGGQAAVATPAGLPGTGRGPPKSR
jgi:hypothetical protein